MGIGNLAIIALVVLAGVGVFSIWSSGAGIAANKSNREAFEAAPTDDSDIDYFVAVSSAINKHRGVDPSTSEVRRTVAEMRKKKVGLKDVDHFVRSRGGRIAVKEPLDDDSVKAKPDDKDAGPASEGGAAAAAEPVPASASTSASTGKVAARKSKKSEKVPAMSASVADRLTKELNSIADRIDDLVDEIAKYSNQPMDNPIQASVSEGFANFSSW
jgi:hypothetical protein